MVGGQKMQFVNEVVARKTSGRPQVRDETAEVARVIPQERVKTAGERELQCENVSDSLRWKSFEQILVTGKTEIPIGVTRFTKLNQCGDRSLSTPWIGVSRFKNIELVKRKIIVRTMHGLVRQDSQC